MASVEEVGTCAPHAHVERLAHGLEGLEDGVDRVDAARTREVHVKGHARQLVDEALLVHDLHHVVDLIERRLRHLAAAAERRLLGGRARLYGRTRLDHGVDDAGEGLYAHVLVGRLGQLDGARQRQLDLVHERVLAVQTVVARRYGHDEQATQRRTVLVAKRLIGRQQIVEQEGERIAVVATATATATATGVHKRQRDVRAAGGERHGAQLARLVRVMGDDLGAAGVRAHQFAEYAKYARLGDERLGLLLLLLLVLLVVA